MDEAASALRLEATEKGIISPTYISDLEKELADIQAKKEAAANSEEYERAARLRQQELVGQGKLDEARAESGTAMILLGTPEVVAQVVENWTNVPVCQMLDRERPDLLRLGGG